MEYNKSLHIYEFSNIQNVLKESSDFKQVMKRTCSSFPMGSEITHIHFTVTFTLLESVVFQINSLLFCKQNISQLAGSIQEFTVVASEGDSEVRATVKVTISDVNNQPPTWTGTPFALLEILENTTVGTIIKLVNAVSTLEDDRVTYKIVQGQRPETNNPKLFDLENAENQKNGEVKVFDDLDYETTRR